MAELPGRDTGSGLLVTSFGYHGDDMGADFTNADRRLLDEFREIVERQFGRIVQGIFVFGSKARGAAAKESDLDILVLIEAGDWRLKDQIADVAYELAVGTEAVPTVMVYTLSEWRRLDQIGSAFHTAVEHDRVAV